MRRFNRVASFREMLKFDASAFHTAVGSLNRAIYLCTSLESVPLASKRSDVLEGDLRKVMKELLERVEQSISSLTLNVSGLATKEAIEELDDDRRLTFADLEKRLDGLHSTLRRELTQRKLYCIASDRARYIDSDEPLFGLEVDVKFPLAATDIQEAGSSLALGRGTATVFHLMRVMEVGMRALTACLALPEPSGGRRNWKVLLDEIEVEISKRSQNANAGWTTKADKTFFQEMHGSLDSVRSAWRNATMHFDRSYSDEEAEHAFLMVRAFMRKLAQRCDESGEPKA